MNQKKYKVGDRVWFALYNKDAIRYYWENVERYRLQTILDFDKLTSFGTITNVADGENDTRIEIKLDHKPGYECEACVDRITLLEKHVHPEIVIEKKEMKNEENMP